MTPPRKRITTTMVAAAAGVSRTAVYAVVNQSNTTNIALSPATREKIERAIKELGYIPNRTARRLVVGKSGIVGLLLPECFNSIGYKFVKAFSNVFREHGLRVVADSHFIDAATEQKALEAFFAEGVDAVIISLTEPYSCREMLLRFVQAGVPVICLSADLSNDITHPEYHYIGFDEPQGLRLIADHLEQCGVTHCAFMCPQDHLIPGKLRLRDLRQAVAAKKTLTLSHWAFVTDYAAIHATLQQWFAHPEEAPEAIVGFNDAFANVLIGCLKLQNLPVPSRVRVIGVDDDQILMAPLGLTTVRLPQEELAQACWECFSDGEAPNGGVIAPELIVRESSPLP